MSQVTPYIRRGYSSSTYSSSTPQMKPVFSKSLKTDNSHAVTREMSAAPSPTRWPWQLTTHLLDPASISQTYWCVRLLSAWSWICFSGNSHLASLSWTLRDAPSSRPTQVARYTSHWSLENTCGAVPSFLCSEYRLGLAQCLGHAVSHPLESIFHTTTSPRGNPYLWTVVNTPINRCAGSPTVSYLNWSHLPTPTPDISSIGIFSMSRTTSRMHAVALRIPCGTFLILTDHPGVTIVNIRWACGLDRQLLVPLQQIQHVTLHLG